MSWPMTYWSRLSRISCGTGRSDLTPLPAVSAWLSSRMMSLHNSMHSSQMKTDGPAISLRRACSLLTQKEQYRSFSPPGFSDIVPFRSSHQPVRPGHATRRDPDTSGGGRCRFAAADQHLVHQTVLYRLFGAEEIVPIRVALDGLHFLPGVLRHQVVQATAQIQDLAGMDFDIGRLALKPSHRLVNHDTGIRQRKTLALRPRREQERPHARGLADAKRAYVRLDELHGVVDRQTGGNRSARGIDVEGNILLRILRLQEKQLRNDQVGRHFGNRTDQEYHALLEQARVDIVGAFAPAALLDDHGYQPEPLRFGVIAILHHNHCAFPIRSSNAVDLSSTLAFAIVHCTTLSSSTMDSTSRMRSGCW